MADALKSLMKSGLRAHTVHIHNFTKSVFFQTSGLEYLRTLGQGQHFSSSSNCTKMKLIYLGYKHCHLALVTSSRADSGAAFYTQTSIPQIPSGAQLSIMMFDLLCVTSNNKLKLNK